MNHDYLDIPFWVQFGTITPRHKYTVYIDSDLIWNIDDCLHTVIRLTTDNELATMQALGHTRVSLYQHEHDAIPFAVATLRSLVVTEYILDSNKDPEPQESTDAS